MGVLYVQTVNALLSLEGGALLNSAHSCTRYITWLNGSDAHHNCVGGKGASLAQLAVRKAPVPPAIAVTTRAYEQQARGLGIPSCASQVCDRDLESIRSSLQVAPIAESIRAEIATAVEALKQTLPRDDSLAVRSSATAEDSPEFSFAGLHDTVLDVFDIDSLEQAVKMCWASLWSDRAVSYRRSGDETLDSASMAVVIQQLIRCDVSFVVFTADPIADRLEHLIITATYGLGEAVVSGLVTPDQIVITANGEIDSYLIGEKEQMIIPSARSGDGVRHVPVPRVMSTLPALSSEQACLVGHVARDLDKSFGFPLDIEGGFAEGKLYLFQVRPITTLNGRTRVKHS
ncbi:hypothetical protein BH23CHL5_BH23CHL5_27490 [soil metagenome]